MHDGNERQMEKKLQSVRNILNWLQPKPISTESKSVRQCINIANHDSH